ncbi:hypothetical protein MVEN_00612300 [Mycena venus]|uniref:Retrotransposon gag domain-containing protein n=1 Tax=Mycena venus TaxID=2733690 RepID=A0A8H6YME8_9AGAR|nr:hypothetical protein MVEN_00612300 [Mycena venus]
MDFRIFSPWQTTLPSAPLAHSSLQVALPCILHFLLPLAVTEHRLLIPWTTPRHRHLPHLSRCYLTRLSSATCHRTLHTQTSFQSHLLLLLHLRHPRHMSKLEFPKLTDELTPANINGWLGRCEDTYEAWQAQNSDRSMEPCTLITLAGLKMEEGTAATWWNENHETLKKLGSWSMFAEKVKERFVPSNWRMVALAAFYAVQQGSSPFSEFVKSLQDVRNALAGASTGYTINNSIMKNHLFYSHPILCLHVTGQQNLPFDTMKLDTLITNMSSTWANLLAEGFIKQPRAAPTPLTIPSIPAMSLTSLPMPVSSLSTSMSTSPVFVPLTHAEKESLRAAGGCYHCRKTPQTPGWVKHRSDSWPGDPVLGIPLHSAPAVVAAVGPAGFSSSYEEGYRAVAVVMPPYNPKEDSFSSFSTGTDDSDLSSRDY